MDNKKLQTTLIIIVSLVFIRGLIYALLIPVDRTPDEIHHFMLVKAKQLALNHRYAEEEARTAAQILLTRENLLYPESTIQRSLADFEGAHLPEPPLSRQLYYLSTACILQILSFENIRDEIYVIRGFSIILGALVVLLSFLTARELFPNNLFIVIGVPVLIAFIPQFSAMNGSINNDKLAEFFVSLFFLLIVKIFKQGMSAVYFGGGIGMIGLALLGKRSAHIIIPLFLIFLMVYYWKPSLGLRMHLVFMGGALGVALGWYVLMKYCYTFEKFFAEHVIWVWAYNIQEMFFRPELISVESLKYYVKFFIVLYWSFWGVFGYMTIHLHHFWYILVAWMQCLALVGLAGFVWQVKLKHLVVERWIIKSLYLFAVSIIFAVVVPFVRSVVMRPGNAALSQGRYLFPVIIPISLLTILGLSVIIPSRYRPVAGIAAIIGLIVLDSICLSKYLLLNFHAISLF